jgi:hypothetical protein
MRWFLSTTLARHLLLVFIFSGARARPGRHKFDGSLSDTGFTSSMARSGHLGISFFVGTPFYAGFHTLYGSPLRIGSHPQPGTLYSFGLHCIIGSLSTPGFTRDMARDRISGVIDFLASKNSLDITS